MLWLSSPNRIQLCNASGSHANMANTASCGGGDSHRGLHKVREQMFSELQGHWKVGWDWALKLFSPSWPTQIH